MKTYNISADSPYIENVVEKFKNKFSFFFFKYLAFSKIKLNETCQDLEGPQVLCSHTHIPAV